MGERLDTAEDMQARERMLDAVERNFYKYEGQRLYDHEKLHAAMRDAGPELAAQVAQLLDFIDRLVEHALGYGAFDDDIPLWREAAELTHRDPDTGNRQLGDAQKGSANV